MSACISSILVQFDTPSLILQIPCTKRQLFSNEL